MHVGGWIDYKPQHLENEKKHIDVGHWNMK